MGLHSRGGVGADVGGGGGGVMGEAHRVRVGCVVLSIFCDQLWLEDNTGD